MHNHQYRQQIEGLTSDVHTLTFEKLQLKHRADELSALVTALTAKLNAKE